jgi:hypothetical protein
MRQFTFLIALVVAAFFCLFGCGAMLNGSTKSFDISCPPQGVTMTSDPNIGEYTVPTTLTLPKDRHYVLKFSKPGYKDATIMLRKGAQFGIVVLDFFFVPIIGMYVDANTSGWNGLTADTKTVFLEKTDAGVPGPDRIRVTVSKHSAQNYSTERVEVDSDKSISAKVERVFPETVYITGSSGAFHNEHCKIVTAPLKPVAYKRVKGRYSPCPICFPDSIKQEGAKP